jgi:hypothetical protein
MGSTRFLLRPRRDASKSDAVQSVDRSSAGCPGSMPGGRTPMLAFLTGRQVGSRVRRRAAELDDWLSRDSPGGSQRPAPLGDAVFRDTSKRSESGLTPRPARFRRHSDHNLPIDVAAIHTRLNGLYSGDPVRFKSEDKPGCFQGRRRPIHGSPLDVDLLDEQGPSVRLCPSRRLGCSCLGRQFGRRLERLRSRMVHAAKGCRVVMPPAVVSLGSTV